MSGLRASPWITAARCAASRGALRWWLDSRFWLLDACDAILTKYVGNVEGDQPSVQLPAKMPEKAEEFISAEEAEKLFKKLNKIFEVNCIKRSTWHIKNVYRVCLLFVSRRRVVHLCHYSSCPSLYLLALLLSHFWSGNKTSEGQLSIKSLPQFEDDDHDLVVHCARHLHLLRGNHLHHEDQQEEQDRGENQGKPLMTFR